MAELESNAAGGEDMPAEIVVAEGEENLQRAAGRAVAVSSQKIVSGLAKKAKQGNSTCAKLLVDFMRGPRNAKAKPNKASPSPVVIPVGEWEEDSGWKDQENPG